MQTSSKIQYIWRSDELDSSSVDLSLIDHLEQSGKIDARTRKQIELAFQEALSNCLEHGNLELDSKWREEIDHTGRDRYAKMRAARLQDPTFGSRKVTIIIECNEDQLEIRVGDEGPGFVPRVKPVMVGDVLSSGRGLALIEECLDEVAYERGGREVVMRKKLK